MASCECCWGLASCRVHYCGGSVADLYHVIMKEHEDQGCICTKPGQEGDKARAGQFWVDGKDSRAAGAEGQG